MLEVVDVPTRIAVAKRFARYLSPPLRVLQRLARDLPDVAAELRAHPLLQPPGSGGRGAARGLGDVACQTATRRTGRTARRPRPRNRCGHCQRAQRSVLYGRCRRAAADLAQSRHCRSDSGRAHPRCTPIRRSASSSKRRCSPASALTLPINSPALCTFRREQARRIVSDELGEAGGRRGKALGMPRDVLYRILMFVNPAVGHSVERVHALAALYDEITVPAAEGMLAIWQALRHQERPAAKHRPLTWDDEAHRARPARQHGSACGPAAATPRTGERRSAS